MKYFFLFVLLCINSSILLAGLSNIQRIDLDNGNGGISHVHSNSMGYMSNAPDGRKLHLFGIERITNGETVRFNPAAQKKYKAIYLKANTC